MDKDKLIEMIFERYVTKENTKYIFLTGSSRYFDFHESRDIDIFIIDDFTDSQFREIKVIYEFEFDINILSEKLASELIATNEEFMIKAISKSNFIWGNRNLYDKLKGMIKD